MAVRIYNTLTRMKEPLVTRKEGRVDIYQCGVTPYDYTHMGHARQYVLWDVIRKYLKYRGYRVYCVQNFTDIDDKIIRKANDTGESPFAIAEKFIDEFQESMDALGVARSDVYPRVTDHIQDIIDVIKGLVARGFGYEVDGDVYYDVSRFPDYGKLSGRNLDEMQAGARVEVDERKDDPMDFALWKKAKPGEPAWDSPWGPGRPGWHIECSVMSLKFLGMGFDMHGGGTDLIFPHHENEIAQSEAYAGHGPFARYWIHHEMLRVNQEKMSKSLGNFFIVKDALESYPSEVLRYFLISVHYRSPANFGIEELEAAKRGLERLTNALRILEHATQQAGGKEASVACGRALATGQESRITTTEGDGMGGSLSLAIENARRKFVEAMDDDFNTALALAALHDLAREASTVANDRTLSVDEAVLTGFQQAVGGFYEMGGILGIIPSRTGGRRSAKGDSRDLDLIEGLIGLIIDTRKQAREAKDWARADWIRDQLKDLGIVLEDTPSGVRWRCESGHESN